MEWQRMTMSCTTSQHWPQYIFPLQEEGEKKDFYFFEIALGTRVTTSDNEWQQVVQRVITSDNKWQRVVQMKVILGFRMKQLCSV